MKHNRNHIYLIALLVLTNCFFGQQTIQWTKTIGGTYAEGVYSPNCIEKTSDNGFIIAAGSLSTNGDVVPISFGYGDYWIIKLDSIGNIIWQKKYGGSQGEAAMAIKQSIYGGYYVAGYSQSNDGYINSNRGDFDVWLLKLNSVGDTIWSKTYGGSSDDRATAIQETSKGNIIFTGFTYSNNGNVSGNHGDYDYWVAMLDSTGSMLWQKTYGGAGEDQANSIEKTLEGGYIIAGYTSSNNGNVTNFNGNTDSWVINIDSIGNLNWQKCFGGSGLDKGYKAIQENDGSFILSSGTNSNDIFIHDHIGNYDSWLVKMNSLGDTLWTKSFGGTSDDSGLDIQSTIDGGYIVGNDSYSNNIMASSNHGLSDYWIYKIDSLGTLQWQNSYGGNSLEWFQALRQTSSNEYILIGATLSTNNGDVGLNHGSNDLFIVKLKNDLVLSTNSKELTNNIKVFPNPCSEILSIENKNLLESSVKLYNLNSQLIYSSKFNHKTTLNLKDLDAGIYILEVTNNGLDQKMKVVRINSR